MQKSSLSSKNREVSAASKMDLQEGRKENVVRINHITILRVCFTTHYDAALCVDEENCKWNTLQSIFSINFPLLATLTFSVRDFVVISYRVISQYRRLALGEVSIDRNVQGCRFFLIPSTLCLDVISRRKEVKCKGKIRLLRKPY